MALGNGELRELACDFVRLKPRELPAPVFEKTPEEQEAEDAAAAQAAAEGEVGVRLTPHPQPCIPLFTPLPLF